MSDISYLKTSLTFEHSNPLKSSPGSHSQSVSGSVGTMQVSVQFWWFHSRSASHRHIYVASVSWTPSLCYTITQTSHPKSTKVKSHGSSVSYVIIAHVVSGDAKRAN